MICTPRCFIISFNQRNPIWKVQSSAKSIGENGGHLGWLNLWEFKWSCLPLIIYMLGVIDDVMDQLCHRWRHWHDEITTLYFFMLLLWKETMGRKGIELSLDIKKLFVVLYENGHKQAKLLNCCLYLIWLFQILWRNTETLVQLKTWREAEDLNLCQTEITENLNVY